MKQGKYIFFSTGIACVLLLLSLFVGVRPAQARYHNTQSFKSFYAPERQHIFANYLSCDGQTVLMQPWQITDGSSRTEDLVFWTNTTEAVGIVECSTESPYLTAQVTDAPFEIEPQGYTTQLRLAVTDAADQLDQPHTAVIRVTLTAEGKQAQEIVTLWADFQICLMPENSAEAPEQGQQGAANVQLTQYAGEDSFAWEEKLIITATAQGSVDTLELMYNGDVFPENTRYCIQQGQWTVLADPMTLKVSASSGNTVTLQLDFSQTGAESTGSTSITAMAYENNQLTGQQTFTVPQRQPLKFTSPYVVIDGNTAVLTPMTGDDRELSWELEYLEKNMSGSSYVSRQDNFSIGIDPQTDAETGALYLKISNESGAAPAGTYRLRVKRTQGEYILAQQELYIFIYYETPIH